MAPQLQRHPTRDSTIPNEINATAKPDRRSLSNSGLMPKRSPWRTVQFDTLRLRLLKLAAQVVTLKTRVMLRLPSSCPYQAVLRLALERMPRLVT